MEKSTTAVEDSKPAAAVEPKTCLQTPHTLRLLKLIREGSPEYARLALERLELGNDRHILWDLLGRLQAILTAPEWKTRQAAATALEHVARTLGTEGESMWLQHQNEQDMLLTIDSLNVDTILKNGRKLYSMAESKFEPDEDIDQATSVQERLRLQRKLLARRLGLGSICSAVENKVDLLPDTITEQDMLEPAAKKRKTGDDDASHSAADEALLPESETPFRNLLVETAASKHTPQTLLATELLVGVLDPVWYIRHGALLGLLALVRAWKGSWGPWLHDALVRVLSVGTILDRFGDYGGSDAVVAPVREMAGQLVAVLLELADTATRERAFSIMQDLAGNTGNNKERRVEWEMRHGVLAVYKFTIVSASSGFIEGNNRSSLTKTQWNVICKQSIQCLSDQSEDVKSAASQVLFEFAQRDLGVDIWSCAESLWAELTSADDVASYIKDLVDLFLALIERDFDQYLALAECKSVDVLRLLSKLLHSQFESIRVAAIRSIGLLASVNHVWQDPALEGEALQLIIQVFATYLLPVNQWETERDETWDKICLIQSPNFQRSLLVSLIDRYFSTEQFGIDGSLPVEASQALGKFARSGMIPQVVLEVAIITMLQSPWPNQCEAACLLYRSFASQLNCNMSVYQFVTHSSFLENEPKCIQSCGRNHHPSIAQVCSLAFHTTLESVSAEQRKPKAAISEMLQLWERSVPRQDIPVSAVQRMRVSCSMVGTLLASSLPGKATPIVRPLVTSFQNETSPQRRSLTCDYTVQFIVRSLETGQHKKAIGKVLKTLCAAVSCEEESCLGLAAASVLPELVLAISPDTVFNDLPFLSDYILTIGESETSLLNVERLTEAIRIFKAISKGLKPDRQITPRLVEVVPALVNHSMIDALHDPAASCLVFLCEVAADRVLKEAVPVLLVLLSKTTTRLNSCRLLKRLIDSTEVAVSPFVRELLPGVLSIITDKTCGKDAYEVFASLVRIAPLVSRTTIVKDEKSVIDHLIFGEPLPNRELPEHVEAALRREKIVLRGYQQEGISWLRFLQSVNLSGALCDDMGLGKTLQALVGVAIAHHETSSRPCSLVVCPSTLVSHWAAEVDKYFPNDSVFKVLCLTGTRDERLQSWNLRKDCADLVVASYSVLRSDISQLSARPWCYCILDEGHLLKNPKTETARAARRLEAQNKLIMTGTPIQNKVEELFSVFDFLMPNFLGNHKSFAKHFASPIAKGQKEGAGAASIVEGLSKLKRLHQQVLPFLLRREKDNVLTELPAKISTVVKVPLSKVQRAIYDRFCTSQGETSTIHGLLIDANMHGLPNKIPEGTFKMLLYLRLLCTHPCLVLDSENEKSQMLETIDSSGKLLALTELLREAGFIDNDVVAADNDQSLLYCNDRVNQPRFQNMDELDGPEDAAGSLSLRETSEQKWGAQRSKCLIFAQFTKSIDIVEKFVMTTLLPSCNYVRLDGSIPSGSRMELVNKFNKDPNTRIMLLTTRVGGVGLNLTAADTVIFLEHDFNPHSDLQAIDRTRRIGQTKVVKVYKIVAEDTIDEKLLALQEKKLALSEAIINTDNSTLYTMGTDRLLDIFSARPEYEDRLTDADLDHLTDSFIGDYESLSASFFAQSLKK